MSIKNWDERNLPVDYSSMFDGGKHPSDIDMFYLFPDGLIMFGEFKNELYNKNSWEKQKSLFQRVLDGINGEALWLFMVHNAYVESGAKAVNGLDCVIKEYCYKKPHYKAKWVTPRKETKLKEVFEKYGLTNRTK